MVFPVHYINDEVAITFKECDYYMAVKAYGAVYYSHGSMYKKNGDPGDPSFAPEFDLYSFNVFNITNESGDMMPSTWIAAHQKDIQELVEKFLYEEFDNGNWLEEEPEEPEEPEYY